MRGRPPRIRQKDVSPTALSLSPFVLNKTTLTLKRILDPAGAAAAPVGTRTEYRCQLNTATLTPSGATGGGNTTTYVTFCQEFEEDTTPSGGGGWTLNLAGFQAYADVTDLSLLLFSDEGSVWEYVLVPTGGAISATNPGFRGTVKFQPSTIGGTAQTYATFTVDLPCVTVPAATDPTSTIKPKLVTTAPGALLSAEEQGQQPEDEQQESESQPELVNA